MHQGERILVRPGQLSFRAADKLGLQPGVLCNIIVEKNTRTLVV